MAGYRERFVRAWGALASALPTSWLIRLSGQRLILPLYHLVADEAPPHLRHLYPIKNTTDFVRDLDFLLKHYAPLDFPNLLDLARRGQPPPQNAFLLTFDDGLREFHDVIAPILRQKGVPAICFLNSDFIGNQGLFFRYKGSLLLDAFAQQPALAQRQDIQVWLARHAGAAQGWWQGLLSIPYAHRAALDELAGLIGLDFGQYLREQRPYLDGAQINSLLAQGFSFGAHSRDHPEYRFLSFDEQIRQTRESVEAVCGRFALPYRAFAFPFTDYGVSRPFFAKVLEEERIAELTFGCAGLKREAFSRHLQRIPFEIAGLSARQVVHAEYLYYLLKAPLGRNVVRRGA
jgi:peptidoglycan/xylan/chitin deacetylase (PgdA/CDA1 family)